MALYVNTNVSSLNSQRQLAKSTRSLDTSYQRLASGLRINSAKDDAAGLQISDRLTTQINGLNQGNRNAQDGISFAQTAEGAMDEMTTMYQRIRTLAIQSANGTNSAEDRVAIQQEVSQLCAEIDRISKDTTFGGQKILDGSSGTTTNYRGVAGRTGIEFQVGADANQTIGVTLNLEVPKTYKKSDGTALTGAEKVNRLEATFLPGTTPQLATDALEDDGTLKGGFVLASDGKFYADTDAKTPYSGEKVYAYTTQANQEVLDKSEVATADNGAGKLSYYKKSEVKATEVTSKGWSVSEVAQANGYLEQATTAGFRENSEFSDVGSFAFDVSTAENAQAVIGMVDSFIATVDSKRAELGAVENRLESTMRNQSNIVENVSDARSQIRDTDFATETANMTQTNILQQASQSILSQANQRPQLAMSLLQG